MEKFQYQILTGRDAMDVPGGVVWYSTADIERALGPQLPTILNELGSQGWEMAGIGDIGYNKRSEIILKRRES